MCIPNMPEQMHMFGPPHLLFEGGYRGEAVIQDMRRYVNGHRKNWERNAMLGYARERSIRNSRNSRFELSLQNGNGASNLETHMMENSGSYKRYSDVTQVMGLLRDMKPISVIVDKEARKIYAAVKVGQQHKTELFELQRQQRVNRSFSLYYSKYGIPANATAVTTTELAITDATSPETNLRFAVLLPRLVKSEEYPQHYALITKNWTSLVNNRFLDL